MTKWSIFVPDKHVLENIQFFFFFICVTWGKDTYRCFFVLLCHTYKHTHHCMFLYIMCIYRETSCQIINRKNKNTKQCIWKIFQIYISDEISLTPMRENADSYTEYVICISYVFLFFLCWLLLLVKHLPYYYI